MKALTLIPVLFLFSACIPTTEMIQDGNAWIQKTEEHRFWGQNVVHVKRCLNEDRSNGFCREHGQYESPTMALADAPGPKLAGSVLTAAGIVAGSALLMHGLQTQAVSPGANILGGSSISTLNACGTGPAFVGMSPAPGCK